MQFVNIQAQYQAYKQELDSAIGQVLTSGQFIGGEEITKLEQELAAYCGAKHAICCASGTDSLLLALLDSRIKPDDEIILPSFTFVATAEVVALLGAKPIFVDIDLATGLLDANLIEAAITRKTRAIIPVSLFGQPAAMDEIRSIAERHDLMVIEDAAQSFGSSYKNRSSCNLSPYGCTSFYPAKPLGCYGDGGAIFTNDEEAAKRLRQLINHGQSQQYEYSRVGINGRLDTIQAAILRVKLKHFDEELARRRSLAAKYDEVLAGTSLVPVKIRDDNQSNYAQYSIYVSEDRQAAKERDNIRQRLANSGIPTCIYYPKPLHMHEAYSSYITTSGLPNSEQASQQIFSIPIHPFLTEDQQQHIIDALGQLN